MTWTEAAPLLGFYLGLWAGYWISRSEIKHARLIGELDGMMLILKIKEKAAASGNGEPE